METKVIYAGTLKNAIDFLDRFEDAHTRRSKALLSVATREAETTPPDGYSRSWRLASISDGRFLWNQGIVSLAQHNADSTVIQVTGEDSELCQRYADGLLVFLDSERQGLSLQPAGAVNGNGSADDERPIPNSKTTTSAGDGRGKPSAERILPSAYRARLRENLTEHFNKEELCTLCFDLGIEHENLPDAKDSMARELVALCERAGRVADLVAKCKKSRPEVAWEYKPE